MPSITKKIKRLLKPILGISPRISKTITCKSIWYGNNYGGFYLNPDLLNKNSIVYSFGIGEDISFDISIIEKHNCTVFGFDPTPKSIEWLNNQKLPPNFIFQAYGIGDRTELKEFYLPTSKKDISGSIIHTTTINTASKIEVPIKSFTDIIKELNHLTIDVLKMDIEGAEYEVISCILTSGVSIKQILIEFHYRIVENGKKKTLDAIKLLNTYGFEIYAISDSLQEISLIRKDVLPI